jgi:CRP-like cAMP-binding protein
MGPPEEFGRRTEVVLRTGSLFGFVDFYLESERRFFATALNDGTRLAVFSEPQLQRMERQCPRLLLVLQRILLKQFAIERTYASTVSAACVCWIAIHDMLGLLPWESGRDVLG